MLFFSILSFGLPAFCCYLCRSEFLISTLHPNMKVFRAAGENGQGKKNRGVGTPAHGDFIDVI